QGLPPVRTVQGTQDAPTFFELFTAIAWLVFVEAGCSDVVLETGMGGRLDSTNVCVPAVTVITLIELEHTRLLGDTLAKIAAEKAGILKTGVPTVTIPQDEEALEVIRTRAGEVGSTLVLADGNVPQDVRLPGVHHAVNARAAYETLRLLGVDAEVAWRGIGATELPGILEVVAEQPRVVVDGAHTPRSAEATRAAVATRWPTEPVVLLTAMLDEKDVAGVVAALAHDVTHVVITRVDSPRCIPPADLAGRVEPVVTAPIRVEADLLAALAHARALAGPTGLVLVAGSIYLAGAVRTLARGGHAGALGD
ncbi:MAG: cyanophycin synthetase, partial [Planctomycetota bacterium]|nr:cyanophycin synthetase [Planctomycetota bacterium]